MAKTKEQKQEIIKNLEQELKRMESLVFVDYYGLNVKEINELRKLLKQKACQYLVTKKTLLKLALKKMGLENIDLDKIKGGVGLVFGFESETAPAKLAFSFAKDHKQLKIQGGIFGQEFADVEMVQSLAMLPSKAELMAQVTGTIKGPLNNLVYVLKGNLKNFVYFLSSIKNR